MSDFSEDQLKEFKEAFDLFHKEGAGIKHTDLGIVLRALNQNPTEGELDMLIKEQIGALEPDQVGILEFEKDFIPILSKSWKTTTHEEIMEAFAVFDVVGSGFIPLAELKYVLSNLGEVMTMDEVEEMLKGIDLDADGQVNYEDFIKKQLLPTLF